MMKWCRKQETAPRAAARSWLGRGELVGAVALLGALLLSACTQAKKPLALVFSVEPIPHEQALRERGWEVRRMPLPCNGGLTCWAKNPGWLAQYNDDVREALKGREGVMLVGVSRGGYLVLDMADIPEVSRVVALSPVTDLGQLREYRGYPAPPLNPDLVKGKRTLLVIGNADTRVGTDAAMQYARAAMNPKLTLVVGETKGHSCPGPEAMLDWLESESVR